MIRLVLLIAEIITVVRPAQAASVLMEQAMELPGFAMWADSGSPGLLLAVVNGKDSAVMGFGTVRPKEDHPEHPNPAPDGRTLIRLGSITKVFTGEMLASLAVSGRVKLTDTLASYLPGVHVPSFNGRPISLLDLVTHSAALPREIGDVPQGRPPFDWPTRAERMAWLDQLQLQWSPGTISSYSNVGFDLLSDALEQAAGEPYSALLRERITGPIGMRDTTFAPDPSQCARMMMGTGLGAQPAPVCTDTEPTEGSGGLYSTADDMVLWMRHELQGDASPVLAISQAVYRLRQTMPAAIGFDEGASMAGIGLAWVMVAAHGTQPMLLDKSGGGGGFMTYLALAPGRGVGVFVAVNRVNFSMFLALAGAADQLVGELATR